MTSISLSSELAESIVATADKIIELQEHKCLEADIKRLLIKRHCAWIKSAVRQQAREQAEQERDRREVMEQVAANNYDYEAEEHIRERTSYFGPAERD